eukprot:s837_g20.t1
MLVYQRVLCVFFLKEKVWVAAYSVRLSHRNIPGCTERIVRPQIELSHRAALWAFGWQTRYFEQGAMQCISGLSKHGISCVLGYR